MKKINKLMFIFSKNMQFLMERDDVNRILLSKKAVMARLTLNKILDGVSMPSIDQLIRISEIFNEKIDDLLFSTLGGDNILREPDPNYQLSTKLEKIEYSLARVLRHDTLGDYMYYLNDDSMEPIIEKNEMVICSKIDKSDIADFKIYVVITENGTVCGTVRIDGENLVISRSNSLFSGFIVKLADVNLIYLVKKAIKQINL